MASLNHRELIILPCGTKAREINPLGSKPKFWDYFFRRKNTIDRSYSNDLFYWKHWESRRKTYEIIGAYGKHLRIVPTSKIIDTLKDNAGSIAYGNVNISVNLNIGIDTVVLIKFKY